MGRSCSSDGDECIFESGGNAKRKETDRNIYCPWVVNMEMYLMEIRGS
jgi:hypothetical protein